jgi:muramidase (phage lysozyme)
MFPVLGRSVANVDSELRRNQAQTNNSLFTNNTRLSSILDNQGVQIALLERLLDTLKSNLKTNNQISAPSILENIADTAIAATVATGALRMLIPRTTTPVTSASRAPLTRTNQPMLRTPTEAAPKARSLSHRALRVGTTSLRILGRVTPFILVYDLYKGMNLLSQQAVNVSSRKRQTFQRTLANYMNRVEGYNQLLVMLDAETDPDKIESLETDIEKEADEISRQFDSIMRLAEELDNEHEKESNRRGQRLSEERRKPPFVETVKAALGSPEASSPSPIGSVETLASLATSLDNEMELFHTSEDNARNIGSVGASMDAEMAFVNQRSNEQSPIRIEGESLIYDFDKIKYEAEIIRFKGLSLAPTAMASPLNLTSETSPPIQPLSGSSAGSASPTAQTQTVQPSSAITSSAQSSSGSGSESNQEQSQPITGTTAQILSTIKKRESNGNYQARASGSSASGAYQFIDSTWQSLTRKYGIGTQYQRAIDAPPSIQDAVAAVYVNDILRNNNNDVSKVPLVWYTGNAQGRMSAAAIAANRGLTAQSYQASWMSEFSRQNGASITAAAPVQNRPSVGPVLTQASTNRLAAQREQIRNTHRMLREFNVTSTNQNQRTNTMESNEVSLRSRILNEFDGQLARAS